MGNDECEHVFVLLDSWYDGEVDHFRFFCQHCLEIAERSIKRGKYHE